MVYFGKYVLILIILKNIFRQQKWSICGFEQVLFREVLFCISLFRQIFYRHVSFKLKIIFFIRAENIIQIYAIVKIKVTYVNINKVDYEKDEESVIK